jgi:ketosteroid isomerase-like protein
MHPNEQLLQRFYRAFNNKDYGTMNACYHAEAEFYDPVFNDLKGGKIRAMWHMLCKSATDLQVTCTQASADAGRGQSAWEAIYTFSATGRKVHNRVASEFTFRDGLIYTQKDRFDLHKWAGMAMGPTGTLLGWLPSVKRTIRSKAGRNLALFLQNNPQYQ